MTTTAAAGTSTAAATAAGNDANAAVIGSGNGNEPAVADGGGGGSGNTGTVRRNRPGTKGEEFCRWVEEPFEEMDSKTKSILMYKINYPRVLKSWIK